MEGVHSASKTAVDAHPPPLLSRTLDAMFSASQAGPQETHIHPAHPGHSSYSYRTPFTTMKARSLAPISRLHARTPYIRTLPLPALLIIALLILINFLVWAICALIILLHSPKLISTAALSYTLGLRHALDADHISAIDLMTRRLIASGQRPVTVGTFFSLGHSTIVLITSIVVAATAAGVSNKFDGFSTVGGIIGSAISASFLLLLGVMNGYILYRLIMQLRKILRMHPNQSQAEAWKIEGGGVIFRILKKLFKVIDKPWKMYPLGVLFGLGFDTSSEIALLGISSIQGAKGTTLWLILVFPVLFTVGMCLVDTIDGALMLALYVKPMEMYGQTREEDVCLEEGENDCEGHPNNAADANSPSGTHITSSRQELRTDTERANQRAKDPIAFLYYSIILTCLTVVVALVIGVIQLLTLILNVAYPHGSYDRFWEGVALAGDNYEVIGGGICGSFVVIGLASVVAYKPWRRWAEARRDRRFHLSGILYEKSEERDVTTLETSVKTGTGDANKECQDRNDGKVQVDANRVEEFDDRISSHVE